MTPDDRRPPVAVITGAVSGIGRAAAEVFRARGASVVLADRDDAGEENLTGVWLCMREQIPAMRRSGPWGPDADCVTGAAIVVDGGWTAR